MNRKGIKKKRKENLDRRVKITIYPRVTTNLNLDKLMHTCGTVNYDGDLLVPMRSTL